MWVNTTWGNSTYQKQIADLQGSVFSSMCLKRAETKQQTTVGVMKANQIKCGRAPCPPTGMPLTRLSEQSPASAL